MTPTIISVTTTQIIFPLLEPFAVATRTATEAKNLLCTVTASDGSVGLGLSVPVEYVTGETISTVDASINGIAYSLIGMEVNRCDQMTDIIFEALPSQPAARAAIEMAIYDIWAKHLGISLWAYYGGQKRSLTSDITIPIVAPSSAQRKAEIALGEGFHHLKLKVGDPNGVDMDLHRLEAVVRGAPHAKIRIDANQAFNAETAKEFIAAAIKVAPNIELIEQPTAKDDLDALAKVHETTTQLRIPLFADESAQSVKSVVHLLNAGIVDGINVKIMKSGVRGAFEIAGLTRERGAKLMIGCMLESNLSLTAACSLAAGTGLFDYIDLDSHRLLAPSSVFTGGFTYNGPVLIPDMTSLGWGVTLNTTT